MACRGQWAIAVALCMLPAHTRAFPGCWVLRGPRPAALDGVDWQLRAEFSAGRRLWHAPLPLGGNETRNERCLQFHAPPRAGRLWGVEPARALARSAVLAALQNSTLVRVVGADGPVSIVEGPLFEIELPPGTLRIPVATTRALAPQRVLAAPPHVLTAMHSATPNAAVEEVLRQVSQQSLNSWVTKMSEFHTRHSESPQGLEAEVWLLAELARFGFDVETFKFEEGYSANVVAKLTGNKYPNKLVVAGAHYDSRSENVRDSSARAPGADDNGSGAAALLEFAKLVSENKISFEYTIVLAFFSGEEQGLLGSRAYADHLADIDADVIAMFNCDMLGWKLPTADVTIGMKDRSVTGWLVQAVNAFSALYLPQYRTGHSSSCCSDYISFFDNGYPAMGFFENAGSASDNPHYHKVTDLPEYINQENHQVLTRALIASVMSFAVPEGANSIGAATSW